MRAAFARTSTRVSSISWIICRIIFSGSSARSSAAFRLALMMSVSREKIPMTCSFLWMPTVQPSNRPIARPAPNISQCSLLRLRR